MEVAGGGNSRLCRKFCATRRNTLPGKGLRCQGVELFGRHVVLFDPALRLAFVDHIPLTKTHNVGSQ